MARKRIKTQRLDQQAQVKALRSAVRQEIVDALQASGPSSVAQLAEITGRAPDSLYYHMRTLHQVGLIRQLEVRPTASRDEVIWDVMANEYRLRGNKIDSKDGVYEMMEGAIKLALRDLQRAISDDRGVIRGPKQNITGGRHKAWLTREERSRVFELLAEVREIYSNAKPGPDRELMTYGIVVCPAAVTQRTRKESS